VVGGLVEHEHVGAGHQRARHVGAHLQAARQLLDRAADVVGREAETVGELGGARFGSPAAGRVVVAEQLGFLHAVIGGAGLLELGLDRHETRIAAAHVLEHRRFGARQLL